MEGVLRHRPFLEPVLLGALACGLAAGAGRATASAFERTFDSTLPLEIVVPGGEDRGRVLGITPSPDGGGEALPRCTVLWKAP